MSTIIDENVVKISFDNERFEKNINKTLKSIDELKSKLFFKKDDSIAEGFDNIQKSAEESIDKIEVKVSALETVVFAAIQNITNRAVDAGVKLVKSLSVDNIATGWGKFGDKTRSVGTLISQGYDMKTVNEQLDKLNWYTDETSYNFTDMVNNISKFTATGQDLETSVTAMMGIANWAAVSGQNAGTASRAMYQLSQAMGAGVMRLEDYKSIQNVSMDTDEFRQKALDAAVAMGTLKKNADNTYQSLVGASEKFTKTQFTTMLTQGRWFTSDVMMEVFKQYGSAIEPLYDYYLETGETASEAFEALAGEIDEFGEKTFKAAQEARTFGDVLDSVKDAVSTGWMVTFEKIFGNYEQAKILWTKLANELYDIFAEGGNERNEILAAWNEAGGRLDLLQGLWNIFHNLVNVLNKAKEAFYEVFTPLSAERLGTLTSKFKDFTERIYFGNSQLEIIKTVFKGLFSGVSIVLKVIKSIGESLVGAFTPVDDLGTFIESLILRLAEFLIYVNENFDKIDVIQEVLGGIKNFIFQLVNAFPVFSGMLSIVFREVYNSLKLIGNFILDIVGKVFGEKVRDDIAGFFSSIDSFSNNILSIIKDKNLTPLEKIRAIFSNFDGKGVSAIQDFLTWFSTTGSSVAKFFNVDFPQAYANFRAVIDGIMSKFGKFGSFVKNVIGKNISYFFNELLKLAQTKAEGDPDSFYQWLVALLSMFSQGGFIAALLFTAIALNKFAHGFSIFSSAVTTPFKTITKMLNSLKEFASSFSSTTGVILALTASLMLISQLDTHQLAVGLIGFITIMSTYTIVGKKLSMISNDVKHLKNLQVIMHYITLLAGSTFVMALVIERLAKLNMNDMVAGLMATLSLLAGMTTAYHFIAKTVIAARNIKELPEKMKAMTGSMLTIVACVALLGEVVRRIGSIGGDNLAEKWSSVLSGVLAVILMVATLVGYIFGLSAILRYVETVKDLQTRFKTITFSTIFLALAIRLMAPAIVQIGEMEKGYLKGIGGFFVIATSLSLMMVGLAYLIKNISSPSVALSHLSNALVKAIINIRQVISVAAVLASTGAIILSIGIAIKLISSTVKELGNLNEDEMWQGLMVIGLFMGMFAAVIAVAQITPNLAAGDLLIVALAMSLQQLGNILVELGNIDPDIIYVGLMTALGYILELIGLLAVVKFTHSGVMTASVIASYSLMLVAIAASLTTLSKLPNKDHSLSILLGVFLAFIAGIAAIGPNIGIAAAGLLKFSVSMAALGVAVNLFLGAIILIGASAEMWTDAQNRIAETFGIFRVSFEKSLFELLLLLGNSLIMIVDSLGVTLGEGLIHLGEVLKIFIQPITKILIELLIQICDEIDNMAEPLVDSVVYMLMDLLVEIFQTLADYIYSDGDRLVASITNLVTEIMLLIAKCFGMNTEELRGWIYAGRKEITEIMDALDGRLKNILFAITSIASTIFIVKVAMTGLVPVLTSIVTWISRIPAAIHRAHAAWQAIAPHIPAIWHFLVQHDPILHFFSTMTHAVAGFFTSIHTFMTAFSAHWHATMATLVPALRSYFASTPIVHFFTTIGHAISGFFTTLWTALTTTPLGAVFVVGAILIIITALFKDEIAKFLVDTGVAIGNFFVQWWEDMKEGGGKVIGGLVEGLSKAWENVVGFFKTLVENVKTVIKAILPTAKKNPTVHALSRLLGMEDAESESEEIIDAVGKTADEIEAEKNAIIETERAAAERAAAIEEANKEVASSTEDIATALAYTEQAAEDSKNAELDKARAVAIAAGEEAAAVEDAKEAEAIAEIEAKKKAEEYVAKLERKKEMEKERARRRAKNLARAEGKVVDTSDIDEVEEKSDNSVLGAFISGIKNKFPDLTSKLGNFGTSVMEMFGFKMDFEVPEMAEDFSDKFNESFDGAALGETMAEETGKSYADKMPTFASKAAEETFERMTKLSLYNKSIDTTLSDQQEIVHNAHNAQEAAYRTAAILQAVNAGRTIAKADRQYYMDYLMRQLIAKYNGDVSKITYNEYFNRIKESRVADDKDIEEYAEKLFDRESGTLITEVSKTIEESYLDAAAANLEAAQNISKRRNEAKQTFDEIINLLDEGLITREDFNVLTDAWLGNYADIYDYCFEYMTDSLEALDDKVIKDAKKAQNKQQSAESRFNEYFALFENGFISESTFNDQVNKLLSKYPQLIDTVTDVMITMEDGIVKSANKHMDRISNLKNKVSDLFDLYDSKMITREQLDYELNKIKQTYPEYVDAISEAIEDGFDAIESEVLKSAKRIQDRMDNAQSNIKDVIELYMKNRLTKDDVRKELKPYIDKFGEDPFFMEELYDMLDEVEDAVVTKAKRQSDRKSAFKDAFQELLDLYNEDLINLEDFDRLSRELFGKYSDLDSDWMHKQVNEMFDSLSNSRLEEAEGMFDKIYEQYQNGLVEWEDFQQKYTSILKNFSDQRIKINKYAVDKMSEDTQSGIETIFDLYDQGLLSNAGFTEQLNKMYNQSLDDGLDAEKSLIEQTETYLSEKINDAYTTYKDTLKSITDDINAFADNLRITLGDAFEIEVIDKEQLIQNVQDSADAFADKMHSSFGDMFVSKTNKEIYDEKLDKLNNELDDAVEKWGSGSLKAQYYRREIAKVQAEYDDIVDKGKENDIGKTTFGETLNKELDEIESYGQELDKMKARGVSDEFVEMLSEKDRSDGLAIIRYMNSLSDAEFKAVSDNFKKLSEKSKELSDKLYADQMKEAKSSDEYTFEFKNNLKDNIKDLENYNSDLTKLLGREVINDDMLTYIKSLGLKEGHLFIQGLLSMSDEEIREIQDDYTKAGELASEAGITAYGEDVKSATQQLSNDIIDIMSSLPDAVKPYAVEMMQKFANGIKEGAPEVLDAISNSLLYNQGISLKKELNDEFKDSDIKPEDLGVDFDKTASDAFVNSATNPKINKIAADEARKQWYSRYGISENSPYLLLTKNDEYNERQTRYLTLAANLVTKYNDIEKQAALTAASLDSRNYVYLNNPDIGVNTDVDITPSTKPVTDVESVDFDNPLESDMRSLLDFSGLSNSVDTLNTTMTTTNTSISDMRNDISGLRTDFEQFSSDIVDAFSNAQIVMDTGRLSSKLAPSINGSLGTIIMQRSR